jgi:hypothetical protein
VFPQKIKRIGVLTVNCTFSNVFAVLSCSMSIVCNRPQLHTRAECQLPGLVAKIMYLCASWCRREPTLLLALCESRPIRLWPGFIYAYTLHPVMYITDASRQSGGNATRYRSTACSGQWGQRSTRQAGCVSVEGDDFLSSLCCAPRAKRTVDLTSRADAQEDTRWTFMAETPAWFLVFWGLQMFHLCDFLSTIWLHPSLHNSHYRDHRVLLLLPLGDESGYFSTKGRLVMKKRKFSILQRIRHKHFISINSRRRFPCHSCHLQVQIRKKKQKRWQRSDSRNVKNWLK